MPTRRSQNIETKFYHSFPPHPPLEVRGGSCPKRMGVRQPNRTPRAVRGTAKRRDLPTACACHCPLKWAPRVKSLVAGPKNPFARRHLDGLCPWVISFLIPCLSNRSQVFQGSESFQETIKEKNSKSQTIQKLQGKRFCSKDPPLCIDCTGSPVLFQRPRPALRRGRPRGREVRVHLEGFDQSKPWLLQSVASLFGVVPSLVGLRGSNPKCCANPNQLGVS